MRNINLRFVEEEYAEDGQLSSFEVKCPESFNFGYDVVDDIAVNDPDRRAMVWCNPEGEEHVFTFGDMKKWSDKTGQFPSPSRASARVIWSWSSFVATISSGSWPPLLPSSARSWFPPRSC